MIRTERGRNMLEDAVRQTTSVTGEAHTWLSATFVRSLDLVAIARAAASQEGGEQFAPLLELEDRTNGQGTGGGVHTVTSNGDPKLVNKV